MLSASEQILLIWIYGAIQMLHYYYYYYYVVQTRTNCSQGELRYFIKCYGNVWL